jgi:hypothetical protein
VVNYYDIWKEYKKLKENKCEQRITFGFESGNEYKENDLTVDDFYEFVGYALQADEKSRDLFSSLNMILYLKEIEEKV